jgi:hypothetical protein
MKILLKGFALLFAFSALAQAELWVKPPYKPDENHPPILMPKEAQEESPDEQVKESKRHQDIQKPKAERGLEKIDDEMNEGEESSQ